MLKIYTSVFLLLLVHCADAQNIHITGRVSDSASGRSLFPVAVTAAGGTGGVFTDTSGSYDITLPSGSNAIQFRFAGYIPQTVPVAGDGVLDVILARDPNSLQEVVVTALGMRRDRRHIGYAVQQLDSRSLSEVKNVNFLDNLTGKLAGVTITSGPTGPGSTSKITIRGESSFSNNNPLFVVDGVPVNNNTPFNVHSEAAAGFQGVDFGNGAAEINADDVESVTVLKGPGAAALYGTRASNGVVVITMKDGRSAKGLGVNFSSTTTVDRPFRLPKFQNRYGQGNSGKFEYKDGLGGGVNDNISYSYGPELNQGLLIRQFDGPVQLPDGSVVRGADLAVRGTADITPTPFNAHPDNLRDFFRTGLTTTNHLSISNTGQSGSFRLSYTDMRSESYIPGTGLDRKTVGSHFHFTPSKRLQVVATANFVNTTSDNRPANGYGSENVNYALAAWGARSLDYSSMKDIWQPGLRNVRQYSFNYTYFDNPYLTLLENTNALDRNRIFGNLRALYQLSPKWSISARSGIDYSAELRTFRRHFSTNRFVNGGYAEQAVRYRESNSDVLLDYTDHIGAFSVYAAAGAARLDQHAGFRQVQATGLAQAGVFSLNNAATPLEQYEYVGNKRINSVYGLVKLGFRNYFFLDLTGRNDWSSALATPVSADHTDFFYPSVSASFVVSNAVRLPRSISWLQLRASLAQAGNDTDPYQTAGVFNSKTPFASQPTLSEQSTIANTALLPEKKSALELGADLRLFYDRLAFDVTWFQARTTNQIVQLPISIASGYSQQVVNGSMVTSRGLEIVAQGSPVRKGNFRWDVTLNFSRYASVVSGLPQGLSRLTLGYNRVYDNLNQTVYVQVEEGGKIGDLYGTGYRKTADGRYILDTAGNFIQDNQLKKLGNYNPDFMLGLTNAFTWRSWRLGFLVDWRQGGILVSRTLALAGVAGQLEETANRPAEGIVADGVVNAGTADQPVYVANTKAITAESYYRQFYDRNVEEQSVYDASFVKLRQVSIGYSFPAAALRKSFLKGLQGLEFSLVGRNLFALSHTPHFDPEQMAVQGSGFVSGVEDMSYPTTRSLGLRININF